MAENQEGYLNTDGLKVLAEKLLEAMVNIMGGGLWGGFGLFGTMLSPNEYGNTDFGNAFLNAAESIINDAFNGYGITDIEIDPYTFSHILVSAMNAYESQTGGDIRTEIPYLTSRVDTFMLANDILWIMGNALSAFQKLILYTPLPLSGTILSNDIVGLLDDQIYTVDDSHYLGGEGLATYTNKLKEYIGGHYLSTANATDLYATKTQITSLQTQVNGKQSTIKYGTSAPTTLSTGSVYVQYE